MRTFTHADRVAMQDSVFASHYRAASAHDYRSDGYFVTGQPMSEIFCRPGCATRTPRPSRVLFYPTAAAAHAAGLIPCPRCRPDATCASPGQAQADTVGARALRLIADGEVDRSGIGGLAARLGVTTRQALRAVSSIAGCGPLDVARAARAQMARLLLVHTTVPINEVAVAAGFSTVRQFNATVKQFYGSTPSTLRAPGRRARFVPAAPGPLILRCPLPVRRPFDAPGLFRFFTDRAVPDVEQGGELWYARVVRLPHGAGHLRLDGDGRDRGRGRGGDGALRIPSSRGGVFATLAVTDPRDITPLYARARRLLDLDADPAVIDHRLGRDPALTAAVSRHPGIRLPGSVDPAEAVIRSILETCVPRTSYRTILGGLVNALGEATPWGRSFPTPRHIARHGREVLRGTAGELVVAVAEALADGRLDVHVGSPRTWLADTLAALPGVGWPAAEYATLRALGGSDVLPLGNRETIAGAAPFGLPTARAALEERAASWSPYRSYAAAHLWRAATAIPDRS